jgi:uncharacterized protein YaeQ
MALQATRLVFRVALSNVDRGVEREEPVNVARHPSETQDHVILRVLAWCLLYREGLEFGPGLSTPDTPDLWARDLTGRISAWIECRSVEPERLKKIINGSGAAQIAFVLDDARRAEELRAQLDAWKRPLEHVSVWLIPVSLVAALAEREDRQHRWNVTIVGDHLYLDADGRSLDGPVERLRGDTS